MWHPKPSYSSHTFYSYFLHFFPLKFFTQHYSILFRNRYLSVNIILFAVVFSLILYFLLAKYFFLIIFWRSIFKICSSRLKIIPWLPLTPSILVHQWCAIFSCFFTLLTYEQNKNVGNLVLFFWLRYISDPNQQHNSCTVVPQVIYLFSPILFLALYTRIMHSLL